MLPVYNEYLKEAEAVESLGTVDLSRMNIGNNVLINSEALISELQRIDSMNDDELYKLLGLAYPILLDIEFINKGAHRIQIAKAFTNFKFVAALCNVLSYNQLTIFQKIACNKLIYDYFTMTTGKDNRIIEILYNLGWTVNKESVMGLYSKGLNQKVVTYLAVARYSTTDDILAVKRVNVIIMNQPMSVMTEQIIVNIYEELFNTSLISLFNGIMFDTWDDAMDEDELDDEQEEIYSTINLAILDILNEMPSDMIVQVLKSYAQSKQYCHPNDVSRFDIHAISNDYSRILWCIESVELEGIMIPHR